MVTTASQAPIAATTVVEHTPCSLLAARGAGAERARTLERRSERPARPSGPSRACTRTEYVSKYGVGWMRGSTKRALARLLVREGLHPARRAELAA
jgi:hypothetical protein